VYKHAHTVFKTGFFCTNPHQVALYGRRKRSGSLCVSVQHIAKLLDELKVASAVTVAVVTERIDFEYLLFLPKDHKLYSVFQLV